MKHIAIIPGVGQKRANRALPPEQVITLIQQLLHTPDVQLHLIGGPDEQNLAENLLSTLTVDEQIRVENHAGHLSLIQTAELLNRCDSVFGADTGPTHLAAALGKKVVSVFGPTDHRRTGPVGNTRIFLPDHHLDCWPCELPDCPLKGAEYLACMKSIPVEPIVMALLSDDSIDTSRQTR